MLCPKCQKSDSQVIDTRECFESVRRRRICISCSFRFTTYERVEVAKLFVVKKDSRRELYARTKLKAGIIKACEKRAISQDQIDETVMRIEKQIFEQGDKEIASQLIGHMVMEALKDLDKIAYIRYASVYLSFDTLDQFQNEISKLNQPKEGHGKTKQQ